MIKGSDEEARLAIERVRTISAYEISNPEIVRKVMDEHYWTIEPGGAFLLPEGCPPKVRMVFGRMFSIDRIHRDLTVAGRNVDREFVEEVIESETTDTLPSTCYSVDDVWGSFRVIDKTRCIPLSDEMFEAAKVANWDRNNFSQEDFNTLCEEQAAAEDLIISKIREEVFK